MARRTPPKKNTEVKGKGKEDVGKGKEKVKAKVKFADSVVETEESEGNGVSDEISEESGEEERENSGGEENQESESEDDGLERALEKVVKLAAVVGEKKKNKKQPTTTDEAEVQSSKEVEVLKVDSKKAKVGQSSKEMEVGQSSKRKSTEGELVKKRQRKEGTKLKEVEGHGSPAALHLVIQHLSTAQKKDVEEIGFGGLLELKTSKFLYTMVDWLLECYDTHTRLFVFNRFVHFALSKHDVYDVFMLPCTGQSVAPVTDGKELVELWREKFEVLPKKDISLDKVKSEMMKLVEGGADFKKMFVLFAMGSFLAPKVHNCVDLRLIGVVENVAAIPQLDWCNYVLDRFDYAVNSWKNKDSKSMGGCLMLVQVIYFHKLVWRGLPAPTTLPLIRHWTYEEMKARVKEECSAYTVHRGFGIGVWDLKTYPISVNQEKSFYRRTVESVTAEVDAMVKEPTGPPKKRTIAKDKGPRCVSLPLPDDLPTDAELQAKYKDERALKWYQTKRNQQLVSRLHRQLAAEMESNPSEPKGVQQEQQADGGEVGDATEQTFTQQLESDLVFFAEFIGMLDKADQALENVVLPPSFDLGISDIGNPVPPYEFRYSRTRERPAGGPVYDASKDEARPATRPQRHANKKK